MKIIYWNVNNNKKALEILSSSDSVFEHKILAFSEYWDIFNEIKELIGNYNIWYDPIYKRTGLIYSQDAIINFLGNQQYFSHFKFEYNDIQILLFILHCKSQIESYEDAYRNTQYTQQEIKRIILKTNIKHVIILGDFNLPHYNEVFRNVFNFNCLNYFNSDDNEYKVYERNQYLKFYNPIAALSGDKSIGPSGTYHYNKRTEAQSWFIFDQILVSYPLSIYLSKKGCEILSSLGGHHLLTRKKLPNKKYSDHLPIRIEFD